MFGQQSNQPANDQIPDHSIEGALAGDNHSGAQATPQNDDQNQADWQHPGVPLDGTAPPPQIVASTAPQTPPAPQDDVAATEAGNHHHDANNLIDIKQQALTQLSPLVGHLEQSPEEKFRTTMMMIQASDDQTLVKTAYDAAQQITDEKAKAQALLDIVNEINYFTQHHQG
jgi:hypothetical protein